MRRIASFASIAAVAATVVAAAAQAGSISVSPLKVNFTNKAGILSVTVENSSREEALVQAEVFSWSQPGGEQKLDPTDDVIAVPPVFKLAPGASQRVRIGLARPFTEKDEQTFRLMVTEVPKSPKPGTVAVAVRHSLPIFVQPEAPGAPSLEAKLHANRIALSNTGNRHLRILRWRLRDPSGQVVAGDSGPGYVLPGQVQLITLPAEARAPLVFEADQDLDTFKIAIGR